MANGRRTGPPGMSTMSLAGCLWLVACGSWLSGVRGAWGAVSLLCLPGGFLEIGELRVGGGGGHNAVGDACKLRKGDEALPPLYGGGQDADRHPLRPHDRRPARHALQRLGEGDLSGAVAGSW